MPKKKPSKSARSKKPRKSPLDDDPAYHKLVDDIGKILEEAYIKGVDLSREHFLNCFSCGCFEGMTSKGSRCVYHIVK